MSKENLEQFMEQIAGSEELQARIGEEIDTEALIALGVECGCDFTAEDLHESGELSDEELEEVAGGASRQYRTLAAFDPERGRYFYVRVYHGPQQGVQQNNEPETKKNVRSYSWEHER
ncbi:MAG: Nif11-like leader peptide family RiPP precursor [Candidatus Poribacteria bacterium]|jgi:predicted ribosomally synthesized peptide with nif11-like leader|nr:Nif11-like leader peptide family RiPP precursor [Candidatus Poribacteria bacterium]|tara:strand:+ start:2081 stop:2434 length:354 start_codon:yes stop_codon:yes gene_type:complete